jgi:hypothetical protein
VNFESDAEERITPKFIQIIAAGAFHKVGLIVDGTVVAGGRNYSDQNNVSGLTGIAQVQFR